MQHKISKLIHKMVRESKENACCLRFGGVRQAAFILLILNSLFSAVMADKMMLQAACPDGWEKTGNCPQSYPQACGYF
ncbi:hypothetical protein [Herminiimonas arsenitoxidans]|uniref:hypothetical protein n=1 Tax=Herminiimonas arsenitoxidans TaxID=1809410 RepID=UPI001E3602B8|nr:hypothetical protein [Herminiimonas arsenitoxidans]